eukprot:4510903-Pleurochrysis_carterae.AAC.1
MRDGVRRSGSAAKTGLCSGVAEKYPATMISSGTVSSMSEPERCDEERRGAESEGGFEMPPSTAHFSCGASASSCGRRASSHTRVGTNGTQALPAPCGSSPETCAKERGWCKVRERLAWRYIRVQHSPPGDPNLPSPSRLCRARKRACMYGDLTRQAAQLRACALHCAACNAGFKEERGASADACEIVWCEGVHHGLVPKRRHAPRLHVGPMPPEHIIDSEQGEHLRGIRVCQGVVRVDVLKALNCHSEILVFTQTRCSRNSTWTTGAWMQHSENHAVHRCRKCVSLWT